MMPRAGFGSEVWARAEGCAFADGCGGREKLERWDAVEFCAKSMGDWGWWIFAGAMGGVGEGIGRRGSGREGEGEGRGGEGESLVFRPWSLVLLASKQVR